MFVLNIYMYFGMWRKICNLMWFFGIEFLFLYFNYFIDLFFLWNIRLYEVINYNCLGVFNVLCGLVVCVILYSCYLSCMRFVDIVKLNKEGVVVVIVLDLKVDNSSFYRNNSGGRVRLLYFILVENFFVE